MGRLRDPAGREYREDRGVTTEDDDILKKNFGQQDIEKIEIGSLSAIRIPLFIAHEALGRECNQIDRELIELFLDQPQKELRRAARQFGYDGTSQDDVADMAVLMGGGGAPNRDDAADVTGSRRFAARAFARLDRKLREAREAGNLKEVILLAFQIGRLTEWWRWRKSGNDDLSAKRKRGVRKFARDNNGRDIANAERKAAAALWRTQARAIAAGSTATGGALQEYVRRELKRNGVLVSLRSIRRALSKRP